MGRICGGGRVVGQELLARVSGAGMLPSLIGKGKWEKIRWQG
jgi:hypothetical protein